MYKVNEKEYDYNSNVNQEIKRKFIDREVMACVTYEAEYILKMAEMYGEDAPFSYGDVENYYIDNSEKIEELKEQIEKLREEIEESESMLEAEEISEYTNDRNIEQIEDKISNLESEIEELEEEQENPQEIFEWWIVTNWLAEKLRDNNEAVIVSNYGASYWGRGCTGQAILLDGVISRICYSMGILEGQENDWSKQ